MEQFIERVDRNSPVPLHHQVKEILLRYIRDHNLPENAPIFSDSELQEVLGVSRITVRRALSDLALEGYISRRPGRGSFVKKPKFSEHSNRFGSLVEELQAKGIQVKIKVLQIELIQASEYVAERLGRSTGDLIHFVKRMISADEIPIVLVDAYFNLPRDSSIESSDVDSLSFYDLLEEKFDIECATTEITLEATQSTEEESKLLEIEAGVPVLMGQQIVKDQAGKVVGYMKEIYPGERYSITLVRKARS